MYNTGTHRVLSFLSRTISWLKVSRQGAAQFALFAMLIQAMLPLSAAAVPASADDRVGETSLPNYFLVICTAYGAQLRGDVDGEPLDKVPTSNAPWDCPLCQLQSSAPGLVPLAPQVALLPILPRGHSVPALHETRNPVWSAAPGLARAPPAI